MNRKSPSEIAPIAYSIEAEEWIKDSTSIKELDEFIQVVPSRIHTHELAVSKREQLHFESNSKIACSALDIAKSADLTAKEALRVAKHEKIIATIAAIIAIISAIIAGFVK